jgi:hypothetical protein
VENGSRLQPEGTAEDPSPRGDTRQRKALFSRQVLQHQHAGDCGSSRSRYCHRIQLLWHQGSLLAEILRSDFDLLFNGARLLAQGPGNWIGRFALMELYQQFQDHWEPRHMLIAVMGPVVGRTRAMNWLRDAESR